MKTTLCVFLALGAAVSATSVPCQGTTCTYTQHTGTNGKTVWRTHISSLVASFEHFECGKVEGGGTDCECLCRDDYECKLIHHDGDSNSKEFKHCESTPYPTPNPTPFPTPSPTANPTPYPTPNPTPFPTPNPTPSPTGFGNGRYFIKSVKTGRYLFATGPKTSGYGASQSYGSSFVVTADANYNNRAYWNFQNTGANQYVISNPETNRYLLGPGTSVSGSGGSYGTQKIYGADADYYSWAKWKLISIGNNKYKLKNTKNNRYVMGMGSAATSSEGGWANAPEVLNADANYYHKAEWYITAA